MRRLVTVLFGLSLIGPGTAAASPAPPVPGDEWTVERVARGYQITLRLAAPARNGMPLMAVDGVPVGAARVSADRRTATAITTERRVPVARKVSLVWPEASATTSAAPSLTQRGTVLPVDPGAAGRYGVETAEYNLGDEAVYLSGIGHRAEMLAKVYSPVGATGPSPVVVFLHGKHGSCYFTSEDRQPRRALWPCPENAKPYPSHRGYDAPATALASHGYHVISVSANAVNAWDDYVAIDGGALARAELILAHLDLWRRWSAVGGGRFGSRFVGRLDLGNVGVMGHSRGGEGVVRVALLNAGRRSPYGIRAVLPLAPTNFARLNLPEVAMSVLLPYCDGDASDLEGQRFYDDTRHAAADQAPRSTVLVMGANHNFFNTEWTPGQSEAPGSNDDSPAVEGPCAGDHPDRLRPLEQQAVGRAYIAGFFRLMLGRETALLPLLDGSDSRAASAGRAVVRVVAQAPARLDLARFDQALPAGSASGGVTAEICAGTSDMPLLEATVSGTALPLCTDLERPWRMPHWVPALLAPRAQTTVVTKLRWSGPAGVVRITVPPLQRDVRRFAALTLRAAPDPTARGPLDLTVRVVDGRGRFTDVSVSSVSDALQPMPGPDDFFLPKTILRTVRIPVSSLSNLDLGDLRAVELRTDRVDTGSVFVSDLTFSRPSVGLSGPTRLPRLSVTDVRMPEGDDAGVANFTVTMSRPSRVPVTVNVDTSAIYDERVITPVFQRLRLAPGQTTAVVSIGVKPNDHDSDDQAFAVVLSVPHNAVVADGIGAGVVLDDDPPPTLTIDHAQTAENAGVLRFPIRLSAPSDKYVFVSGELTSGTAVLGDDFRAPLDDGQGEPLSWVQAFLEPGQTTTWLEVVLLDDTVREPDETFSILIEVQDATLSGPSVITGTIQDDDS